MHPARCGVTRTSALLDPHWNFIFSRSAKNNERFFSGGWGEINNDVKRCVEKSNLTPACLLKHLSPAVGGNERSALSADAFCCVFGNIGFLLNRSGFYPCDVFLKNSIKRLY